MFIYYNLTCTCETAANMEKYILSIRLIVFLLVPELPQRAASDAGFIFTMGLIVECQQSVTLQADLQNYFL